MNLITPEYISKYISLKYGNTEWEYVPDSPNDIPKIQAEGSAKLWNIMQRKGVALLADEVGMGKTYQALAIIITLWLEKPDAKVLLYAPNENVATKWINEYETFIRYHYKLSDDKIKSSINGKPLRKAVYCENQLELLKSVNQGWPSLFVCKTSTLSNFLSKKITQKELDNLGIDIEKNVDDNSTDEEKAVWMGSFARKCNEFMYKKLAKGNNPPFDLIVFDEAHYLRNAHSDTNRSLVAHAFFAKRDLNNRDSQIELRALLCQKALLLTATPNHSSSKNIQSIVSIFKSEYSKVEPTDILNQLCVRRFRRLNNKTKHQYRKELDEPVEMTDIKEKLFFALYQRSLVKHKADQHKKNTDSSKSQNPYKLLYGYLEGFEFLPTKRSESIDKKNEQNKSTDFQERDDKKVIQELAEAHFKVYRKYPIHPKYNKTIENLSPRSSNNFHPEKKVVFVRRIPSVYELTRRIIEVYDQQFTSLILDSKAFDVPSDFKNWNEGRLRKYFATKAKSTFDESEEIDETGSEDNGPVEEDTKNVSSKYFGLFTIKKDGKFRTTDCSNFRNRFLKELTVFSLFLQPGSDYLGSTYTFNSYLYQGQKRNYALTARKVRFDGLDIEKQYHISKSTGFLVDLPQEPVPEQTFHTLITIWIKTVQKSSDELLQEAYQAYIQFTEIEKEAFANYLGKGLFFSSGYLVMFYAIFKSITKNQNSRADELYHQFCKEVERTMKSGDLAILIAKAITSFQIFYKKELNLTEENLLAEKWTFLNNTAPVYPVCADTNRKSILKAFNTPFYPNVLVATSVLQEGVDLHYHCNEIIHYGLAWTQGDNEQRVGRVDRLNGKMENKLRKSETSFLPIHYPYLKNTIDQDQTARFILRKREAEKLIDQFIHIEQSNEINYLERMDESIWKNSFNQPDRASLDNKDPFPVVYDKDFKNINTNHWEQQKESTSSKTILNPIFNALAKRFSGEFYIYDKNSKTAGIQVFAIKHIRSNGRHQPIIAEFNYYEPGLHILGKPVYYLRIKTPIYRRGFRYDNLELFGSQISVYNRNPVIKIGFDQSRKDEFKYYVFTDLPIFYTHEDRINISDNEVIRVTEDLINFADDLERIYTEKDIRNEVIKEDLANWKSTTADLGKDRGNAADFTWLTRKNYLYQERKLRENFDLMNHIYSRNTNELFVKYYRRAGRDYRCVGFYKNDALEEEIKLYEYILENESVRS